MTPVFLEKTKYCVKKHGHSSEKIRIPWHDGFFGIWLGLESVLETANLSVLQPLFRNFLHSILKLWFFQKNRCHEAIRSGPCDRERNTSLGQEKSRKLVIFMYRFIARAVSTRRTNTFLIGLSTLVVSAKKREKLLKSSELQQETRKEGKEDADLEDTLLHL